MPAESDIQMIEATFTYFTSLGDWHQDPDGLQAVSKVKDKMIQDLQMFSAAPSKIGRAHV